MAEGECAVPQNEGWDKTLFDYTLGWKTGALAAGVAYHTGDFFSVIGMDPDASTRVEAAEMSDEDRNNFGNQLFVAAPAMRDVAQEGPDGTAVYVQQMIEENNSIAALFDLTKPQPPSVWVGGKRYRVLSRQDYESDGGKYTIVNSFAAVAEDKRGLWLLKCTEPEDSYIVAVMYEDGGSGNGKLCACSLADVCK